MEDRAKEVLENFQKRIERDKKVQNILKKVEEKKARQADVYDLASATGNHAGKSIVEGLQESDLEEMIRETIHTTLKENHRVVQDCIDDVQDQLNKEAGLGLRSVTQPYPYNKADGLAILYMNKEKYTKLEKTMVEYVEAFSMGIVDKAIRSNAEFHHNLGIRAYIERIVIGECCSWCSKLAGRYDYDKVSNTGNDVFRRHRCCRCIVEYVPSKGRRVNVHTKKEVIENQVTNQKLRNVEDVTREYLKKYKKKSIVSIEEGIDEKKRENELHTANWMLDMFGGDITILKEKNIENRKTPDFLWNGEYWELKRVSSENSIDKRIKYATKQIGEKGGIILDITNSQLPIEKIVNTIDRRAKRRLKNYNIDIIIKDGKELVKVYRNKK